MLAENNEYASGGPRAAAGNIRSKLILRIFAAGRTGRRPRRTFLRFRIEKNQSQRHDEHHVGAGKKLNFLVLVSFVPFVSLW